MSSVQKNLKIFYSRQYEVDIGRHVFPTAKYTLIKDQLIQNQVIQPSQIVEPPYPSDQDLLLVHTEDWFFKLRDGRMTGLDEMQLELPYSPELYSASMLCVGGTTAACLEALEKGVGIHIGGGFHHAFPDHGEGFCVFNDIAVGIRVMQKQNRIKKALVVDLDVHQGNGTAYIFKDDPSVFAFSMHQENNYPLIKPPGKLDIGLKDGTADQEYLSVLEKALQTISGEFKPDLLVYQAGADTYAYDQLGGLGVSLEGMKKRDETVFQFALRQGIPYAVTLGGGYASELQDTVTVHANTIRIGIELQPPP